MTSKEYKYPMFLNCHIACPYGRRCGKMIQREALSCIDQVKHSIPETFSISTQSQTVIDVLDMNSEVLATIESGKISENI